MLQKYPFVAAEHKVVDEMPGFMGRTTQVFNTPVTPRMNTEALLFDKRPCWMPLGPDFAMGVNSPMYSVKLGRGLRADSEDCFGIKWQFVEQVGGSIVHPGAPLLDDVNDWKEIIHIPDIDSWDWEAEAALSKIDGRFSCQHTFINGFWFERLISFMDFMGAAMALIDEDQEDALHELFDATTDLACRLVDKYVEYWPQIDGFNVHDDWGSQKAPFFSQEVAYKFFVPQMKKLTDHIHSKGRFATLHSCGHNADRIMCYIDGGFDEWIPQPMNDIKYLYKNFGDKICLGVWPDDQEKIVLMSEADQRAAARDFVNMYNEPGKPSHLAVTRSRDLPEAFMREVYEYSRKLYLEW